MAKEPVGLTTKEAADACGVHPRTIKRKILDGKFPNAKREGTAKNSPWKIPLGDLTAAGLVTNAQAQSAADQREARRDADWQLTPTPDALIAGLKATLAMKEEIIAGLRTNNEDLRLAMRMLGPATGDKNETENKRLGWFGRRKQPSPAND